MKRDLEANVAKIISMALSSPSRQRGDDPPVLLLGVGTERLALPP
jgi:hypothetical protein